MLVVYCICVYVTVAPSLPPSFHPSLPLSLKVFHCVSQLELAQLVGTGVKTRYLTTSNLTRGGGAKEKSQQLQSSRTGVDAVLTGTGQSVRDV